MSDLALAGPWRRLPLTQHAARHQALLAYGLAFLIGFVLTFSTFPLPFLLGTVDWVRAPEGDLAINVIGQRYFFADAWRWPLLLTTKLDAPHGINMALLDSIPLGALPFKLLAPWLPQGAHAVYAWYAVAWLLQPLAAVWCLRSAGEHRLLPAVGVAVAAASMPAWWHRFDHVSLCSHFLLLMTLGLYLRLVRRPSWQGWIGAAALQIAGLLAQPYLAVMVSAVLGAVPLTLLARRDRRWLFAAIGLALSTGALYGAMGLLGYLGATGGEGFGTYSMNLLGPVWPQHSTLFPWLRGPGDATGRGGWEGYNYLGAGLLVGLAAVAVLRFDALKTMLRRHLGLVLALAGLTALALSQRPAIGTYVLFDLGAMPAWIENFRSSGRFFWPVAYALLVGTILLAARHPRPRVGAFLILTIGALQFADATELRQSVHQRAVRYGTTWRVDEQALRVMLAQHDSLTLLPSWLCVGGTNLATEEELLIQTMLLASETGIPISTSYKNRWQEAPSCDDQRFAAAPLGRGELRILTPAAQVAFRSLVPRADELCSPVGSLLACRDPAATSAPPNLQGPPPPPPLVAGAMGFGLKMAGVPLLGEGWSNPEQAGVWSIADRATLRTWRDGRLAGPLKLDLELQAFAPRSDQSQEIELWAGSDRLGHWRLPDRVPTQVSAVLPPMAGTTTLEFRMSAPASPLERGVSHDKRPLGVFLARLHVTPAENWPRLTLGETSFTPGSAALAALGSAWTPAPDGAWSTAKFTELHLDRPSDATGPLTLRLKLVPVLPGAGENQTVELWVEGRKLATWKLRDRQPTWVDATLPAGSPGPLLLQFRVASPQKVGGTSDPSGPWLGFQLQAMQVEPAPWWRRLPLVSGS